MFINAAGTRLLGTAQEDILGKSETDLFGPLTGFETWESDHQVLVSGEPYSAEVTWKIHSQKHTLQIIKYPYTDQNGGIMGILGVGTLLSLNKDNLSETHYKSQADNEAPPPPFARHHSQQEESEINNNVTSLNRTLLTLQSAILTVASSLDLQHIFETLIWEMVQLIKVDNCVAFKWEKENSTISPLGIYKQQMGNLQEHVFKLETYPLLMQVVTERRTMQLIAGKLNPTLPEQRLMSEIGMQSLLLIPMLHQEQVVGLIGLLENQKQRTFSDWEISLAQMLANQAASSIVNAQLYEEVEKANHKLQVSNEELNAFAHTVAHDLKGPLGRMIGFSEMVLRDGDGMTSGQLNEFLQIIAKNGHKMNEIIEALLLLSTVRQKDIEITHFDMINCVVEAKHRVELQYENQQAEILIPETLPPCRGYETWITEVWTNYLSNAIKYGGCPPRIQVGAMKQKDSMVRYWVRDNGQGLSPSQQAQLFTPFTRLNQESIAGHGLGLSIVRRIIEKLGGKVGVDSELGHGSTFYFTLPGSQDAL